MGILPKSVAWPCGYTATYQDGVAVGCPEELPDVLARGLQLRRVRRCRHARRRLDLLGSHT